MGKVTITIPGIGNVEAENAASEDTLLKILAAVQKSEKAKRAEEKASADALKRAREEESKQIKEGTENLKDNNKQTKQKAADDKKMSDANKRSAAEWSNRLNQAGQVLGSTAGMFGQSLLSLTAHLASSYDEMARNPISASSQLLNAGIDLAKNSVHAVADLAKGLTSGIPIIGNVVGAMSEAAKAASELAATILKTANDIFAREFQKSVDALHSYTRAGASFAGGMLEMRTIANDNSLSLRTLSEAAKNAAADLHATGLSQGEATKILANGMGAAAKTIGKSGANLRSEMLAMGYSYQEQGEIMASYMANTRTAGQSLAKMAPAELAQRTREYAQSLKVLSDISGQDAKKAMEKARLQTMEADLLAEAMKVGGPEAVKKLQVQLASMPESMKKGYMEFVSSGGKIVTDVATNIAMQNNPKIREQYEKQYSDLRNRNMMQADALKAAGQYTEQTGKYALANLEQSKQINMAGRLSSQASAGVTGAMSIQNDVIQAGIRLQEGQTAASDKAAGAQADLAGKSGALEQSFTKLTDQSEKFAMQMEKMVGTTGALATYGNILAKTQEEAIGIFNKVLSVGGNVAKLVTNPEDTMKKVTSPQFLMMAAGVVGAAIIGAGILKILPSKIFGGGGKAIGAAAEGGAARAATGAIGGMGESLGSLGKGVRGLLSGLGHGAGDLVHGLLAGIGQGLKVFSQPQVIGGAAGFGVAIAAIGAGIAAASWIMGKALPTLAEGLLGFEKINGKNLINVGLGMIGLGAGFAAFGAGAVIGGVGNLISNIIEALPGKSPLEKFVDFSRLSINGAQAKANAEAFVAFSNALSQYKGTGQTMFGAMGEKIASFFGVKLPTDKLVEFSNLRLGPNAESNARAFALFAQGLQAYKSVGGDTASIGAGISNTIAGFFGAKPPLQALIDFSKQTGINEKVVQTNANALVAFSNALTAYKGTGQGIGGAIASGISSIFNKPLPLDQLTAFSKLELGKQTENNARAMVAFSNVLATYKGTAQTVSGAITERIAGFFQKKLPTEQFAEFSNLRLGPNAESNSKAFSLFAQGLQAFSAAGGNTASIGAGISNTIAGFFGAKPPLQALIDFGNQTGINEKGVQTNSRILMAFSNALSTFKGAATNTAGTTIANNIIGLFRRPLPLQQFAEFSNLALGERTEANIKAMMALNNALSKFTGGEGAGEAFSKKIAGLFGTKSPVEQLVAFSDASINSEKVTKNAEALNAFSKTLKIFTETGADSTGVLDNLGINLTNIASKFDKIKPAAESAASGFKTVDTGIANIKASMVDLNSVLTAPTPVAINTPTTALNATAEFAKVETGNTLKNVSGIMTSRPTGVEKSSDTGKFGDIGGGDTMTKIYNKISELVDSQKEQLMANRQMIDELRNHTSISTKIYHASV